MSTRHKRILPTIAVTAAAVTLITVVLLGLQRRSLLDDSGTTTLAVGTALRRLQDLHPSSLSETGFQNALTDLRQSPYVARVWLLNPDGSPAGGEREVVPGRASSGIRRILDALPPTVLSEDQEGWLLAAYTVQAEGEHSDVFDYLLRPIERPEGTLIGIVGVSYDVNPWVSSPGAGWIVGVLLALAGLCVYWLALPLWVYLDAVGRGENAWAWAIFVLVGNLVALIAYILAHSFQQDAPPNGSAKAGESLPPHP